MLLDSAEREVGRWWRTCVSANFSPLFRLCLQNELRQLRVARGLAKEASIRLLAKAMSSQELAEVGAQGLAEQAQQARKEASAICCCLVFDFRMFPKQVW